MHMRDTPSGNSGQVRMHPAPTPHGGTAVFQQPARAGNVIALHHAALMFNNPRAERLATRPA